MSAAPCAIFAMVAFGCIWLHLATLCISSGQNTNRRQSAICVRKSLGKSGKKHLLQKLVRRARRKSVQRDAQLPTASSCSPRTVCLRGQTTGSGRLNNAQYSMLNVARNNVWLAAAQSRRSIGVQVGQLGLCAHSCERILCIFAHFLPKNHSPPNWKLCDDRDLSSSWPQMQTESGTFRQRVSVSHLRAVDKDRDAEMPQSVCDSSRQLGGKLHVILSSSHILPPKTETVSSTSTSACLFVFPFLC